MKFARLQIKEYLDGVSKPRRHAAAFVVSVVAAIIVDSLVNKKVYANVGLNAERAIAEAKSNIHHQNLMRMSCVHLMDFLSEVGLLTPTSMRIYRTVHML